MWRSRASSEPPRSTPAAFSAMSATSARMRSALARKASDEGEIWVCNVATLNPLRHDLAADQPTADFAGAGADLIQLGVAQQAAGRVIVDIAVAAEQLDGVKRHQRRLFGGKEHTAGGVLAGGL